MASATGRSFDVVVIGAGPAGIAAAVTASKSGASVALLDDNPSAGGQIWRGETQNKKESASGDWFARLRASSVQAFTGARVFHIEGGRIAAETDRGVLEFGFRDLILATGARELFLPFPGWTLPNVFGAGGLQALMKTGLPVDGKRIVIAGTGPLLFAVASYARQHGAQVVAICEQATLQRAARFALATTLLPGKIKDAVRFAWDLRGVPHWTSCWPVEALGRDRLERIRVTHRGKIRELECDYLACGFHLIPNLELARYAECEIENRFVRVDEFQRTSRPHIYCVGEPIGIGGVEMALAQGQIAGYAAGGKQEAAREIFGQRARYRRFAQALATAFSLRPELKSLADPETFLCRCEDVPFGRVAACTSWREAKLHTRCGMGACQGRVCGSAAEFLFGWDVASVRPPVCAVQCGSLAALSSAANSQTMR